MLVYNQVQYQQIENSERWSDEINVIHPSGKDGLAACPEGCICRSSNHKMKGGMAAPHALSATALLQITEWHKILSHGRICSKPPFCPFNLKDITTAANISSTEWYAPIRALAAAGCLDTEVVGRDMKVLLTPTGLSRWICIFAQQSALLGQSKKPTSHVIDLAQFRK